MRNHLALILSSCLFVLLILGCEEEHNAPRPKGYFRINLPEKTYQTYSGDCPFTFEFPDYAHITTDTNGFCWINVVFQNLKATVYLSYSPVQNNLDTLLEDSRMLVFKHTVKANDIITENHLDTSRRVFVTTYSIYGNAASEFQFQATDSLHHFLRGSLYFNVAPNRDSLQPVVKFVEQDIEHLINTLSWQEPNH